MFVSVSVIQALLCLLGAGCHLKCHKEHADKGDSAMQPCVGGKGPLVEPFSPELKTSLFRTVDQLQVHGGGCGRGF